MPAPGLARHSELWQKRNTWHFRISRENKTAPRTVLPKGDIQTHRGEEEARYGTQYRRCVLNEAGFAAYARCGFLHTMRIRLRTRHDVYEFDATLLLYARNALHMISGDTERGSRS